jgi:chromosome segregation ATPase
MISEDLVATNYYRILMEKSIKKTNKSLLADLQSCQSRLTNKLEECAQLSANYKRREESHHSHTQAYNANLTAMQENSKELSEKNQILVEQNETLKHKLASAMQAAKDSSAEIDRVKNSYSLSQNNFTVRENELSQALKFETAQKVELAEKFEETVSQLQAFQTKTKAEQTKFWDEINRLKNSESQLLEEADKLTQELQEKTVKLHYLEAEKASQEDQMRGEITGASHLTNTLKSELERRLEDLVQIRKERF